MATEASTWTEVALEPTDIVLGSLVAKGGGDQRAFTGACGGRSASALDVANDGTAQSLRVYSDLGDSGGDYERLTASLATNGDATLKTVAGGAGTVGALRLASTAGYVLNDPSALLTPVAGYLTLTASNAVHGLNLESYSATAASTAAILARRSGSNTLGASAIVPTSAFLLRIQAYGDDGSASYKNAANIYLSVDGAPGTGSMPGLIDMQVSPSGSTTPTSALKIRQDRTIDLNRDTADVAFFNFIATDDADTTSALSTLTTSGAVVGHAQVDYNGTKRWLAILADPS